jgi:tryptophan synthase beta subunit
MGNIQELEKQLAEAKAEKKELQTLTENLSKYQGKLTGVTVSKKNRSAYASAVFYEKFWVTGNTITVLKWNISLQSRKKLQILK